MKPAFVRYAQLFCAAAVLTIAFSEVVASVSDAEAFGLGTLAGIVATAVAKKFALLA